MDARQRGRLRHRVRELRMSTPSRQHIDLQHRPIRATPRATGVRTAQLVIGDEPVRGERRVDLARHGSHAGLEGRIGNDPVGAEPTATTLAWPRPFE